MRVILVCAVVLSLCAMPQRGGGGLGEPQDETRLPNGKLQRDEILKSEHEQNVKDAAKLAELVEELRQDIEKNDQNVLSISTLKKTDDIEKLAKKIRSRLRHS
jgi:hypothetical protein